MEKSATTISEEIIIIKDVQVIASGSSSVELADKIEEPMTGRKFDYTLMPLSFAELAAFSSPVEEMRKIEQRMIYGMYPDVVTHPGDAGVLLAYRAAAGS